MKNGYTLLNELTINLNNSNDIINSILKTDKLAFANNEEMINVSIGLVKEVANILNCLDDEVYILNKKLYDLAFSIKKYAFNLFNSYKFVNAYKLYDCLTIDIYELKNLLNSIK